MLTLCMSGFLAFLKSAVFVVGYISNNNNLFPEPLSQEEEKEYLEKYFLKGNTHCWGVLFDRELTGVDFSCCKF